MKLPLKFKSAIENPPSDLPDYAWLAYAVCARSAEACGWSGWLLDGVFKRSIEKQQTVTGDRLLSQAGEQECPRCGNELFRTGFGRRMEASKDQDPPWKEGVNYTVAEEVDYE